MMRTLAETGNGWMTFKDAANAKCNQTGPGPEGDANSRDRVVHLSNLCTEIIEVTSADETAVCNLGSVNLGAFVQRATTSNGSAPVHFDFARLGEVVRLVVGFLDRVIDINYYPTDESEASNRRWRPVGLGLMGLQDVFFKLGLAFDSAEARNLSRRISEEIYFNALWASTDLAEAGGPHPGFADTRAAAGELQFDLWSAEPSDPTAGVRCASGSPSTGFATRCSSRSPRPPPSRPSPAATSASSPRCRTCSSARPSRASSCR